MNKFEFFKLHHRCTQKMLEISRKKNNDYTGNDVSPFANFNRVELLGICNTEQGFLTRMTDKLSRLISFSQKGVFEVEDEKVEDTLLDLANYCILLYGYIESKKEGVVDGGN